jgi:hypothetical protein
MRRLGGISRYSEEEKLVRDVSTSLDMTKTVLALTIGFLAVSFLRGQETSPSPSPPATPSRSVRISFVPPPLEGKISLGVYNEWGQLVRVLHQEAEFDEFTIGADALSTKWDGKDDYDYDLPAGKYSARGFLVAPMKIEQISQRNEVVFIDPAPPVRIKLVANPLENNERPTVDLVAGFDDDSAYIQTVDGLPLVTVAKVSKDPALAVDLDLDQTKSPRMFVRDGDTVREFRITGLSKMMAFDCGQFELK